MLTDDQLRSMGESATVAANCHLVSLGSAALTSDDFDDPAGISETRWAGESPAYLDERTERVDTGTRSDVLVSRTLVLLNPPADAQQGDTVTVRLLDSSTFTSEVRAVARRRVTTRLTLEDG